MQNNETGPLPKCIYKDNSKLINSLNISCKTIKLLEEYIGVNLHDLSFGSGFLNSTPNYKKRKHRKVGWHKNFRFLCIKDYQETEKIT